MLTGESSAGPNLEASWTALDQAVVHGTELEFIRELTPLLNLQHNPRALPEFAALRAERRAIAAGLSTPPL